MSPQKASTIVEVFPSVDALMQASTTQIAELKCGQRVIGPRLAEAIKAIFRGSHAASPE